MDNNERIEIYISTRNRPDTILKSLDSVLNQTYKNIEIIVSDNSTNDTTYELLINHKDFNKIKYIKRNPTFDCFSQHLNQIRKEIKTNYYMIFHDDDEMLPNMVEVLYNNIKKDSTIAAIGSNAYTIRYGKKKGLFFKSNHDVTIKEQDDLIYRYCSGKEFIAPFPSYLYNKELVGKLENIYSHGGMYSDASFLVDLLNNGKILILRKPLMNWYIYRVCLSHSHNYEQYFSLINYFQKIVKDKSAITNIRIYNIYNEAIISADGKRKYKFRKNIFFILLKYSPYNYFLKYIIKLIHIK